MLGGAEGKDMACQFCHLPLGKGSVAPEKETGNTNPCKDMPSGPRRHTEDRKSSISKSTAVLSSRVRRVGSVGSGSLQSRTPILDKATWLKYGNLKKIRACAEAEMQLNPMYMRDWNTDNVVLEPGRSSSGQDPPWTATSFLLSLTVQILIIYM